MFDTKKFENIEDPEVKKLVDQVKGFFFPKVEALQKSLSEKQGTMKAFKIVKEFIEDTTKEYKEKYGTDINDDARIINDYMGINQSEILDMLKMFKK